LAALPFALPAIFYQDTPAYQSYGVGVGIEPSVPCQKDYAQPWTLPHKW